jgi:hypothetical protein
MNGHWLSIHDGLDGIFGNDPKSLYIEKMPSDDTIAERLDRLENQLARLQDEQQIRELISSYGPAVDSGDSRRAANIWVEDGVYDAVEVWRGRAEIAGMVDGETHQRQIAEGCAHVLGVPLIVIDGDRAVATCYSRVFLYRDETFKPWRVAANRWEFVRTSEGWFADSRVNRLLDGSDEARALLGRAPQI